MENDSEVGTEWRIKYLCVYLGYHVSPETFQCFLQNKNTFSPNVLISHIFNGLLKYSFPFAIKPLHLTFSIENTEVFKKGL